MKNDVICPHCKGQLRIDNNVIFSVKSSEEKVGLIFLSPKLGDYTILKHSTLELKEGDISEIYCPVCHHNLIHSEEKKLAGVLMQDSSGGLSNIFFSIVFGTQSTYKVKDEVIEKYGRDADTHIDFETLSFTK